MNRNMDVKQDKKEGPLMLAAPTTVTSSLERVTAICARRNDLTHSLTRLPTPTSAEGGEIKEQRRSS